MRFSIVCLLLFINTIVSKAQIHEVEIVNPSNSIFLPFTNVGQDVITVLQLQQQSKKSTEYKVTVHNLNTKYERQTIQVLPKRLSYSNSIIFNHFYHNNRFFFLEKSIKNRSKWNVRLSSLSKNPNDKSIVFENIIFKKSERLVAHTIKDNSAFIFTINRRKKLFNIYQLTINGQVKQQSIQLEKQHIKLINENYQTNIALIDYDGHNSIFDMIQDAKIYMNGNNKIRLTFDIEAPYQYDTQLFDIDFPNTVSQQVFTTRKEMGVANYHTSLINNDLHIISSTETDVIYEVIDIQGGKNIHRDRDNFRSHQLSIGTTSAAIRVGANVTKTGNSARIMEKMISFSPFVLPEKHQDTTIIYLGAVNSFFKNAEIPDDVLFTGTNTPTTAAAPYMKVTRERDEPEGSFIIMESSFSINRKIVKNKATEIRLPRIWQYGLYETTFKNTDIYRFQGNYYCGYYNSGRKTYSFIKI